MLNHELLGSLNVKTSDEFEEEYKRVVGCKPNSDKINKKVIELLYYIAMTKNHAEIYNHGCIEKLKTNDLLSMKIKLQCNIRILFSLEKDGTILLHSFEEKAGKKVTEYSSAIETAKGRLQKMKGRKK